MPYIIQTFAHTHCPEVRDESEAVRIFREEVSHSMKRCKQRYGAAYRHRGMSRFSAIITLGPDSNSALYTTHVIIKI